ncbi:oligosaccharide flippase family protein [Vibrio splendidus]|uniref:oligosaccharide flippase family protein n=1 Tax=Vibrio splendidus TaxID=29497 RepID=UPI000D347785|nr:oligosaccharide flippase family protein [Vibrio splendidus]PTP73711.1 hypothetical protein CWO06_16325 [Vibrio splendidus]
MNNSIFVLLSKVLSLLITFICTALAARELGVELFGTYSLIKSIVTFIFVFSSIGNDIYIISKASEGKQSVNLRHLYILRMLVFFILVIPVFVNFESYLALVLSLTYLLHLSNFGIIYCLVNRKGRDYFKSSLISFVICISFTILISVGFLSISYIYIIPLYYLILNGLMFNFSIKMLSINFPYHNFFETVKMLWRDVWPIMLTSSLVFLYTRVDIFMMSSLMGSKEVGTYSIAMQLTEPLSFVVTSFAASIVANLKNESKKHDKDVLVVRYIKIVNLYSLSILIGSFLFGEYFILLIFGHEYQSSYIPLLILSFSKLFVFANTFISSVMIVDGNYLSRLFRTIITLALNVIISYILIPIYGMNGAAISVLITQAMSLTLVNFYFTNTRQYALLYFRSFKL